jgi:hypothetical protein
MSQITLYLDETTESRVRQAAKAAGVSLSRWVSVVIREKLADEWPESVIHLAGAWRDFPAPEEIKESPGEDLPREAL